MGLAFYVWDYGVKAGSIQVLGASSYVSPLLSTMFLIAAGFARPSWPVAIAAVLVTAGAVTASSEMLMRRPGPETAAAE